MRWIGGFIDWLDSRTGVRTARGHLLDEPLPPGVGWWFVTGSILLMLLTVQFVTGVVLTFYYVPSPEFAYDSVRYVMERVTFGRVLRGLHFFGTSFIVVAAVIHMLRVVALGSYKKPREVTWITGVTLLLVIFGFALSGYLLPWDQKAYWATTVTINIARSGPFGEYISGLLQGGTMLYFPGPLEPLATMVIPGLIVALLFLLPFLDSHADRHPMKRPLVTSGFAVIGAAIIVLTYLGYLDTPAHADPSRWTPLAIAGREIARNERCVSCRRPGGAGNPIDEIRARHDPEWLLSHVRDPEVIAPGIRPVQPGAGLGPSHGQAIVAYMRKVRTGGAAPMVTPEEHAAALVFGIYCASCHMIDGEGGSSAPDLTRFGATRDPQWLRDWISEPTAVDPFANMPSFGGVLRDEQMDSIVNYLAPRK